MANIVRCELPDGVQRFKPFTVEDYRDLLLVRNDMNTKSEEDQKQLIAELMDDYFHDHPVEYRPYIFLKVFLSSIGKTKIPVRMNPIKLGIFSFLLIKSVKMPTNKINAILINISQHPHYCFFNTKKPVTYKTLFRVNWHDK